MVIKFLIQNKCSQSIVRLVGGIVVLLGFGLAFAAIVSVTLDMIDLLQLRIRYPRSTMSIMTDSFSGSQDCHSLMGFIEIGDLLTLHG